MDVTIMIMVLGIVLITAVAGVFKAKYRKGPHGQDHSLSQAENAKLRDEVRALKERLQVLERITVEKENSLEREIERLRDR